MKKIIFSLLFASLVGFIGVDKIQAQEATTKLEMDVKGMTCKGCEYKVKQSLKEIEGVVSTELVSHESGKVIISYDPGVTNEKAITSTLAKSTGYTVSSNAGESKASKAGCDPAKCTKSKEECAKASTEGKACCASKAQQKECSKSK